MGAITFRITEEEIFILEAYACDQLGLIIEFRKTHRPLRKAGGRRPEAVLHFVLEFGKGLNRLSGP
jgi:hypothetical protein